MKQATAEGLAQRIANGDVPETIKGNKVITLDVGLLVAGTKYRGEFEERLKKLMEEIKHCNEIIFFIDEVHTLIGAGAGAAEGMIDAANILKPVLARGELQHIEKDPVLERLFQPVKVLEPPVDETLQILKGLCELYEIHHKVRYTDEALVSAAQLSYQYISDHFLPDKAIELIDEAGSRVQLCHAQLLEEAREVEKELRKITEEKIEAVESLNFEKAGELRDRKMDLKAQISAVIDKNKEMTKVESEAGDGSPVVTEVDIQHIVSPWTGIPIEKVSTDEFGRLLKMETLHTPVIGRTKLSKPLVVPFAVPVLVLKTPTDIASFIFSGPTGYIGYVEGGQLTEVVRRRPCTVVLLLQCDTPILLLDHFLPDKAIELIDEAGSRVQLCHAQLLEEAREVEKELRKITEEKIEAVKSLNFEKAGELLDREMDLKAQISALIDKNKEMTKVESEAGDGGPVVTEVDIQHIVSPWTGIPVEKVSSDEFGRLLKMEKLHTPVIGRTKLSKPLVVPFAVRHNQNFWG
ncbi:unnamed protein product [Fraxinus pennsylvanica]|uniref:UVR domain-containing protein n=1 Tax=Fraxinus pennsylvanica TaxID=56036 RepID=A0AAD1ZQ64_9LAMI|nr:unnamed protein product [Fraxinus pennsylvanica]